MSGISKRAKIECKQLITVQASVRFIFKISTHFVKASVRTKFFHHMCKSSQGFMAAGHGYNITLGELLYTEAHAGQLLHSFTMSLSILGQ